MIVFLARRRELLIYVLPVAELAAGALHVSRTLTRPSREIILSCFIGSRWNLLVILVLIDDRSLLEHLSIDVTVLLLHFHP